MFFQRAIFNIISLLLKFGGCVVVSPDSTDSKATGILENRSVHLYTFRNLQLRSRLNTYRVNIAI